MARALGAAVLACFLLVASTALAIWWNARQDSRPSVQMRENVTPTSGVFAAQAGD